jgi:superfamily II DNA helicase RecQ
VVAPYAELKRQLVIRCKEIGLDCEPWPKARDRYPRLVIVSAEAASSDDFLQWAAEHRVRGRLDRIVLDECHLAITAADEYRKKLRGLVLLRQLACPMVFLTGTLPPHRQREFEEAMQLDRPRYICALTYRIATEYSVLRVGNGRGMMEVKRLIAARKPNLGPGGKGVIYCTSHTKCKILARQLGCHYYHGIPRDVDSVFLARGWLLGLA